MTLKCCTKIYPCNNLSSHGLKIKYAFSVTKKGKLLYQKKKWMSVTLWSYVGASSVVTCFITLIIIIIINNITLIRPRNLQWKDVICYYVCYYSNENKTTEFVIHYSFSLVNVIYTKTNIWNLSPNAIHFYLKSNI